MSGSGWNRPRSRRTSATTYDSAGRAIANAYLAKGTEQWRSTTIPDGDRTTTLPPAGGTATTAITNGLGQRTRLLQYKDPAKTAPGSPADTTTYTYTRSGQQASITDTTGKNVWTFGYDLNGRKISSSDPDTGTTTFTYDDAGKLIGTTDARHRRLSYTYDNLGRKTAEYDGEVTSGTKLAEWTYDTLLPGLATASIRYADGKTYKKEVTGYDTAGRSTGSTLTIPVGETGLAGTYRFGITYDPNSGAVRTMSSPAMGRLPDEEMSFGYSPLGIPLTMLATDSDGGATQLVSLTKYNPMGQVLRTNFQDAANPNQVSVTNTYEDGTNRLATTQAQRATSANYWIANRGYTYNPAGGITKIADTPAGAPADVQCFRQDYLQRLTDAWTPSSGDCATTPTTAGVNGAAPYWTSWAFDDVGNRKTQVQHTSAGDVTTTSTYPASGDAQPHAVQAMTTTGPAGTTQSAYSYDERGSTKSRGPDGAAQTFTYDAEGHVATAKEANGATSSYLYDADGGLLIVREPTGTTLTVGDTELTVPTGGTKALGTRFYSYNGQVIATRKGDTGLTWKLSDHLGTTYATVDAGNLAVSKRWQDPYGLTRGAPLSTWPDKHGYVGGYQLATGLTHLGARDYDPATGRFLSVDPVLNPADPQSMNGYGYGDANPVNLADPSGLYVVGGVDPNTGVPYGVSYNDHGGATLVGIFPESELAGAALLNPKQAKQQRAYHARVRRAEVKRHLSTYSPMTNDFVRLESFWSMMGSAYSDRDFWDTATGVGNEHACFGARGCQMAWIHLEENPNDIEGAKSIAAFYCVENYAECAHTKFWDDSVHQMFQDLLMLGAMGLGGAGSVAEGEAAATGVGGAARAEVEAETAAGAQRFVNSEEGGLGRSCPRNSFTGDTPVRMADGTSKPIEEVEVGDEVENALPGSDWPQRHVVTALHVTDDDKDFVDVAVETPTGTGLVKSTAHHLFWDVTTHRWVAAANLWPGDQLDTPGGGRALVAGVHHHPAAARTYNLTVDGVHTFYVVAGDTPVLVHNDPVGPNPLPDPGPGRMYLWRAVTAGELGDIAANRAWNSPQGVKYFSFTEQGASEYARRAYAAYPQEGPYTMIRTSVAASDLPAGAHMAYTADVVDGGVALNNDELKILGRPSIMTGMSVGC